MKRASIAVAVLVALTLTGCAGTPDSAPDEPEQAPTSTSERSTDDAPAEETPTLTEEQQEFVAKETWETLGIENEDLIAAADLACEEFADGKTTDQMTLPGIPAELTDYFANSSREWFCPAS